MSVAKELYYKNVDWYGNVNILEDADFNELVSLLENDLKIEEYFVRSLIQAKLTLIKFNREIK